jgi:hypothetical protein
MTIKVHFDGKAFVPDEPVKLPLNQEATVHLQTQDPVRKLSDQEFDALLADMDRDALTVNHPVDWSRDSIYSGTLDDTR